MNESPTIQATQTKPASMAARQRRRVMMIDDDPLVSRAVIRFLQKHHDVTAFENAKDAFQFLQRDEVFDVILCDLMMPNISGMDFYHMVSEQNNSLEQRIIFFTGGAFTPKTQEFIAQIDNPVLDKPFAMQDVLDAVAGVPAR